jgi:hypothetical protein
MLGSQTTFTNSKPQVDALGTGSRNQNKFSSRSVQGDKKYGITVTTEIDLVAVTTREPDANARPKKKDTTKRVLDSLKDCGPRIRFSKNARNYFTKRTSNKPWMKRPPDRIQ